MVDVKFFTVGCLALCVPSDKTDEKSTPHEVSRKNFQLFIDNEDVQQERSNESKKNQGEGPLFWAPSLDDLRVKTQPLKRLNIEMGEVQANNEGCRPDEPVVFEYLVLGVNFARRFWGSKIFGLGDRLKKLVNRVNHLIISHTLSCLELMCRSHLIQEYNRVSLLVNSRSNSFLSV